MSKLETAGTPDAYAEERKDLLAALRSRGVRDERVLKALEAVPRERFVEPARADLAYADQALPIACGQTISQPYVVAAMTEALAVAPHHKVLEIGTGSGYQAALLAHLAAKVVTIERYPTLAEAARERLQALGLKNVTVLARDGALGAPEHAPFDRIIVTAAAAKVPPALLDQLAEGGILVAPIGSAGGVQDLVRLEKRGGKIERQEFMAVRFVPLLPGVAETH